MGLNGAADPAVLEFAAEHFDVLLTADRKMVRENDISKFTIRVVVMAGRANSLIELQKLVPDVLTALPGMRPGSWTTVRG